MSFFTLFGRAFPGSLFTPPGTAQTDSVSSSSIVGSTPHRRAKVKPLNERLPVAETTHVSGPGGEPAGRDPRNMVGGGGEAAELSGAVEGTEVISAPTAIGPPSPKTRTRAAIGGTVLCISALSTIVGQSHHRRALPDGAVLKVGIRRYNASRDRHDRVGRRTADAGQN